ncbi:MAG TPA: ABC transporter permease [Candidatus Omnitrophota bacterium]|nr:ABC transporter permease [Candidatus Omnitrophota bacterium]HPT06673.1 ABC transporter permease [Candidatus Omnitrophota bacterium]
MWERIKTIVVKEFIQAMRDPRMRVVMFVMPAIQLFIFSFAVSTDVKKIPTAIYDLDNTQESRRLTQEFTYSKYFVPKYYIADDRSQRQLLDTSLVSTVIRFNRGFGKDLESGKTASVQLIVDGTDSNTAMNIVQYAGRIVEQYSSGLASSGVRVMLSPALAVPQVELRNRSWFNENLESRNYYIPGVIAMVIMLGTLLLTAMAIVKEKEIGTIEQLIVSPISSFELILGKFIPFAAVGIIDLCIVTTVAVFVLGITVKGDLLLLFIGSCLFILNTLGLGLFISVRARTQQEALMSLFMVAQPMVLLSGFVFPIANMPWIIQLSTFVNPLRYYLVIIRGIFLKASGFDVLWPQMAALLVIGISIVTMSSLFFHKRLG